MGTPKFAVAPLRALVDSGHEVISVFTNPDKQQGRGRKFTISPVKDFALQKNIEVVQPISLKAPEIQDKIRSLSPDFIVVVAYGKLLPKTILAIPRFGSVNIHASLLPKYRGPAPIQWALINGEQRTGVATMLMDDGLDTGDIIMQKEVEINEKTTVTELFSTLSELGAQLLLPSLEKLAHGEKTIKQTGESSYAPMITKEMAKLDFNKTGAEIINLVRGLSGYLTAWFELDGERIKVFRASKSAEKRPLKCKNGDIIKGKRLLVAASDSVVSFDEIQAPGGKRMDADAFLRGRRSVL